MHLVYYTLGVCIVNGWLLYRRHCHQNGTFIQYIMHLEYALLMDVAVQKTLPTKWYIHLVYYTLGVCIVNGWLLYRRHRQHNGTCIQYTMHLEYALLIDGCCIEDCHQNGTCIQYSMHLEYTLLIDGCCIEDTAIKMVHAFSILCR